MALPPIDRLPNELLSLCLELLEPQELLRCTLVSHLWWELSIRVLYQDVTLVPRLTPTPVSGSWLACRRHINACYMALRRTPQLGRLIKTLSIGQLPKLPVLPQHAITPSGDALQSFCDDPSANDLWANARTLLSGYNSEDAQSVIFLRHAERLESLTLDFGFGSKGRHINNILCASCAWPCFKTIAVDWPSTPLECWFAGPNTFLRPSALPFLSNVELRGGSLDYGTRCFWPYGGALGQVSNCQINIVYSLLDHPMMRTLRLCEWNLRSRSSYPQRHLTSALALSSLIVEDCIVTASELAAIINACRELRVLLMDSELENSGVCTSPDTMAELNSAVTAHLPSLAHLGVVGQLFWATQYMEFPRPRLRTNPHYPGVSILRDCIGSSTRLQCFTITRADPIGMCRFHSTWQRTLPLTTKQLELRFAGLKSGERGIEQRCRRILNTVANLPALVTIKNIKLSYRNIDEEKVKTWKRSLGDFEFVLERHEGAHDEHWLSGVRIGP